MKEADTELKAGQCMKAGWTQKASLKKEQWEPMASCWASQQDKAAEACKASPSGRRSCQSPAVMGKEGARVAQNHQASEARLLAHPRPTQHREKVLRSNQESREASKITHWSLSYENRQFRIGRQKADSQILNPVCTWT